MMYWVSVSERVVPGLADDAVVRALCPRRAREALLGGARGAVPRCEEARRAVAVGTVLVHCVRAAVPANLCHQTNQRCHL
eukprot:8903573-Pyramimonas_sp.AAC.1